MIFKEEAQLHQSLKAGAKGLYILWGEEDYLINRWKDRILKDFLQDEGFNFSQLDGRELPLNDLYDATQQLPVFAPQRGVLFSDVDSKKLVAEEMRKLETILAELPEETLLVITFRGGELKGKSALGKKVVALGDTHGTVIELTTRNTSGLVRFLQGEAKKWGCSISPDLCRELLRLCGKEMLILTQEVQKVSAYAGGGEITQRHLDAVVSPITEERIFDLGKAILGENPQRAMEILANLFYLQEHPIGILATLIMSYVDLYRSRSARDQGKNVADILAILPYGGRDFRIRNAFSTKISTKAVVRSLEVLFHCDRGMKSTPQDQKQQLERAVLQLTALRGI